MTRAAAAAVLAVLSAAAQSPESIRPPGSLRLAGVLHDPRALNRAHDVRLQGDIAFVAGKGGSLALVDIRDKTAPRLLSSLVDPVAYDDAETVLPMGRFLLLGTRDLLSIDLADPKNPRVVKRLSDLPRIDRINGMALRGPHLFAANKSGYIDLFDVGDPANPSLLAAFDTRPHGQASPHDVAVSGDHIIVPNTDRGGRNNVAVYRVADAETHKLLPPERWVVESTAPTEADLRRDMELRGANRVAVWDGHAAIGAFVADRVGIFRLTGGKLTQLANLPVCDIDATGMTVSGRLLFVSGGECVEAIDVSDPANPVSVAQYRGGALFPTRRLVIDREVRYDNGHDLVYRDGFLYVTAQNDHRLGILELTDPKLRRLADDGRR